MKGRPMHEHILDMPLDELLAAAAARRDARHGTRLTFSPKVFIPLTMLCRDQCGYCTFAQPPARLDHPYLAPEDVLTIARRGALAGCHEALFTLGERPELRYDVARDWLRGNGYDSTIHYVAAMAQLVLDETGLLPHANAGALDVPLIVNLANRLIRGTDLESARDPLDVTPEAAALLDLEIAPGLTPQAWQEIATALRPEKDELRRLFAGDR